MDLNGSRTLNLMNLWEFCNPIKILEHILKKVNQGTMSKQFNR